MRIEYDPTGKFIKVGRYWIHLETGMRVPVIQGGTSANTVQNDRWAFGDDDGTESGHTLDTELADRSSQLGNVTFLIRIQVQETAGKADTWTFQLYADKNGGASFTAVTTTRTDGLRLANDTQSRADNQATTERLTAPGSGTWLAGLYDDGQTEDGMGSSLSLNGNYTELEFAIEIDTANASDGDYWDLRVESNTGTDLDSYGTPDYPRVTASIPAPINITPSAAVAGADSVNPTTRQGSINITPTAGDGSAIGTEPTEVRQSSLSLSPTLADASAVGTDPTYAALVMYAPTADNSLGNWTDEGDGTTNIYTSIDEVTPSDADYVQSEKAPSTDIYKVKMASGTDPATGDNHFVDYRYRKDDNSGTINLTVRLVEGTTTRATWNHNNISTTWVQVRQALSTAEANSITDYTNLYLEFEASQV